MARSIPPILAICYVIQTLQVECLDHFLVFGEKHFDYLVREYVEHYHTERPHQGVGNQLVLRAPPAGDGEVQCRTRLGGLLIVLLAGGVRLEPNP